MFKYVLCICGFSFIAFNSVHAEEETVSNGQTTVSYLRSNEDTQDKDDKENTGVFCSLDADDKDDDKDNSNVLCSLDADDKDDDKDGDKDHSNVLCSLDSDNDNNDDKDNDTNETSSLA
jgi:hypothetical protein